MPHRAGLEFPDGDLVLNELVRLVGNADVLEFGCGRGRLAPLFNVEQYTGVDICQAAIELARERNPGHNFGIIEPFSTLPKRSTVFAYTVLHHIPDELLPRAVQQLADAAPRVILAEIMNPDYAHENMPPCWNRSAIVYERLFAEYDRVPVYESILPHAAYETRYMTVLELC